MALFFIWALATEPDFKTSQRSTSLIISMPLCLLEIEMLRLVDQRALQGQRHLLSHPAHQSLKPVGQELTSLQLSFHICEMGPIKISSEVLGPIFNAETISAIILLLLLNRSFLTVSHCPPLP